MIEQIAVTYVNILRLYIEQSGDRNIISVDAQPEVVSPEDLAENWVCYAQDQAMTPISEAVRKREYIQSIPLLQQLGVPTPSLLKELVRALGLPQSFYEEAEQAMAEQAQASQMRADNAAQGVPPDVSTLTEMGLPLGPNNLQSIPMGDE